MDPHLTLLPFDYARLRSKYTYRNLEYPVQGTHLFANSYVVKTGVAPLYLLYYALLSTKIYAP